jgi:putative MFS transporter
MCAATEVGVAALAAVGGVVVWLLRRRLPESPRWLAATGRHAEADAVVQEIEPEVGVVPEDLPPVLPVEPVTPPRRRSALLWAMWTLGPVGFYAFASIVPIVFLAKGFDVAHSLAYLALTAIGYPVGSLVSVWLSERVERRALLIGSTFAAAVFGAVFGTADSVGLILFAGTASTLSSIVQSNVSHIYQAELCDSRNRSTAIGLPYSASRLITALLPLVAIAALATIGAGWLYTCCGALLLLLVVLVRILGPRTNNRRLDTI